MDTLGSRCSFLLILGCLWGVSWAHIGGTFLIFLLIWSVKMGDGFQVHFFSDPRMEMMSGCRGCMCYNHSKNKCFRDISLFLRIREFSVSREGFRCHFGDFWWPWRHFQWYLKVLGAGLKFNSILWIPWGGPRSREHAKWRVKMIVQGGSRIHP